MGYTSKIPSPRVVSNNLRNHLRKFDDNCEVFHKNNEVKILVMSKKQCFFTSNSTFNVSLRVAWPVCGIVKQIMVIISNLEYYF